MSTQRDLEVAKVERERRFANKKMVDLWFTVEEGMLVWFTKGRYEMGKKVDVDKVSEFILRYGSIDGDHHKTWVLDQVLRMINTEGGYKKRVAEYRADGYGWDEGIAPPTTKGDKAC